MLYSIQTNWPKFIVYVIQYTNARLPTTLVPALQLQEFQKWGIPRQEDSCSIIFDNNTYIRILTQKCFCLCPNNIPAETSNMPLMTECHGSIPMNIHKMMSQRKGRPKTRLRSVYVWAAVQMQKISICSSHFCKTQPHFLSCDPSWLNKSCPTASDQGMVWGHY